MSGWTLTARSECPGTSREKSAEDRPGEADGGIEPEREHLQGDDVEQVDAQPPLLRLEGITLTPPASAGRLQPTPAT